MTGDLLELPSVFAIGAASSASPAPKVFTSFRGYEVFSSKFYFEWTDLKGQKISRLITPESYFGAKGPYHYLHAYRVALSYGPFLRRGAFKNLVDAVTYSAICEEAPFIKNLGIDPSSIRYPVTIKAIPKPGTIKNKNINLTYQVQCK